MSDSTPSVEIQYLRNSVERVEQSVDKIRESQTLFQSNITTQIARQEAVSAGKAATLEERIANLTARLNVAEQGGRSSGAIDAEQLNKITTLSVRLDALQGRVDRLSEALRTVEKRVSYIFGKIAGLGAGAGAGTGTIAAIVVQALGG